jgi:hypothetical protein
MRIVKADGYSGPRFFAAADLRFSGARSLKADFYFALMS